MDRIVEVKVNGSHVWKDSQHAGTQGEVNATWLRIEFDDGWDGFAKTITWWDAKGENPTSRVLTAAELEDIKASTRIYLTPIVPEALAIWGKCMFSIDGYINGRRQKSAYASMVVKPCGNGKDITIEVPTPSKIEQLQVQIDVIIDTIHDAVEAKEAAEEARGKAVGAYLEAKTSELNAQAWAEGGFLYPHNGEVTPVDPVVGAKGYADQARAYVEGGRVQLSTGPAVYPPYSNGAKGEADRAKAYAEGGTYLEWVYDEETRGWKQVEVTVKGVKEYAEQRANIIDVTRLPSPSYSAEELPNLTAWAETENAGEYSWSAYDDDAPIPEGYYTIKAPDGKLYAFSIPNRSILGDDEFSVHQVDLFWNSADGISGTETFEYYEYDRRNDVHRLRTIMSELQFSEEKELNDNAFYRLNGDLYYYDPSAAKRLATEDDVRQLSEDIAGKYNPVNKTPEMTIPVGVDENGCLWVAPIGSSGGEDSGTSVVSIEIDKTEITVGTGATVQLTATVTPADATNKTLEWYSSNEGIATVDNTGLVTGVAEGDCTIIVSAPSGAYAECKVSVSVAEALPEWTYEWDYTMGLPEDNGMTVVSSDAAYATMEADGLLLTAAPNEEYSAFFQWGADVKSAVVECDVVLNTMVWNGRKYGFGIFVEKTALLYTWLGGIGLLPDAASANQIAGTEITPDGWANGATALFRIEYAEDVGVSVYLNGDLIITTAQKAGSMSGIGFWQRNSGKTLVKYMRVKITQ